MIKGPDFRCNLFFLSGSFEEQWFLHCLSALQPRVFHACHDPWERLTEFEESDSLDIYYTNPTNREGVEALAAVRAARNPELGHGLLLGGDENFLASPRLYRGARFVIRTYLAAFHRHPRIFTIPEGPFYRPEPARSAESDPSQPISVFFSGQLKYSRIAMAKAFEGVPDAFIVDPADARLSPSEYLTKLASARFALCPNGNTTPDTLRLYESLEMGVVPIAERTVFFDYLGQLFKPCPVPRFASWRAARDYVESLDSEVYALTRSRIHAWWEEQKLAYPMRVFDFVNRCLMPARLPDFQGPTPLGLSIYRFRAFAYLFSISSPATLMIRFRRMFRKLAFAGCAFLGTWFGLSLG